MRIYDGKHKVYLVYLKSEYSKAEALDDARKQLHQSSDILLVGNAKRMDGDEFHVMTRSGDYWCVTKMLKKEG